MLSDGLLHADLDANAAGAVWRQSERYAARRAPDTHRADRAGSLILGYAVVASTGLRLLGGIVLLIGGLWCIQAWSGRHEARTATMLGFVGLAAFVISHLLALAIGAWPAVLLVAAAMAALSWTRADSRTV